MRKWVNKAFRWYYKQRYKGIRKFMLAPHRTQSSLLTNLIQAAKHTQWGKKYGFRHIRNHRDFSRQLPICDYEDLKPFIEKMMHGEKDVLWSGRVQWFAKSSGTTSGKSKFIPVSNQNLKQCHTRGNWDAMTLLYHNRPNIRIFEGKSMLMGGSLHSFDPFPKTTYGDVSAIMIQQMPLAARPFFAPDFETALMSEWEEKVERLAQYGSRHEDIVMIGGVPTWTIVLFRRILEITGKSNMLEVWPDFQVYIHGGVSFTPYRKTFREFFPSDQVSYQEIYNATEGYFSIQSDFERDDMLLLLRNGIYYEFLPMEEWHKEDPQAIPLSEVEIGKNYAMVISTNAGLWRYVPGDTVMFTETSPYKIKVTGRTKQFVNAFGEEVIVDNADRALDATCRITGAVVSEYTVAPVYFKGEEGKGGHEWLIEFETPPEELEVFADLLDAHLQKINSDYEAKRYRDLALERLRIQILPKGTFLKWMRARGKLGGQNKVPRLANNRHFADQILQFIEGDHVSS